MVTKLRDFIPIRPIKSAVGLKAKFAILIFILSKLMYLLILQIMNKGWYELIFHLLPTDVIVRINGCMFYCRRGTDDLYIIDPKFEEPLHDRFNIISGTFIDVEAHIGRYAILIAKRLKGVVIAIEPDPANFLALKKSVALNNLTNVILLNIAASDKNGGNNSLPH